MLLLIAGLIVVLWLIGFTVHLGGGLIHILLILAVVAIVAHLIRGHRTVR